MALVLINRVITILPVVKAIIKLNHCARAGQKSSPQCSAKKVEPQALDPNKFEVAKLKVSTMVEYHRYWFYLLALDISMQIYGYWLVVTATILYEFCIHVLIDSLPADPNFYRCKHHHHTISGLSQHILNNRVMDVNEALCSGANPWSLPLSMTKIND